MNCIVLQVNPRACIRPRMDKLLFFHGKLLMMGEQCLCRAADCYVVVSPEYNHTVPPALAGLMGAFGGSNYIYKPAATVTYSPSPWGGMRCALSSPVYQETWRFA